MGSTSLRALGRDHRTVRPVPEGRGPAADPNTAHIYRFLIGLSSSLEALSFAFLFTMVLLFVSRRASLRQINANLIEISEKLERLEQRTIKAP